MNNKVKIILIIFLLIFITIIFAFVIRSKKDDIYYRVYSNNKWSSWYKNGQTAGDLKNNITEIEIKTNDKNNNKIYYKVNVDGIWSKEFSNTTKGKEKRNQINGIKIDLMGILRKKYDIYYRTYNKKDKWMGWSWNYMVNGNKKRPMTGIEIQLIEKDSDIEQNIKDYDSYKKKDLNYE